MSFHYCEQILSHHVIQEITTQEATIPGTTQLHVTHTAPTPSHPAMDRRRTLHRGTAHDLMTSQRHPSPGAMGGTRPTAVGRGHLSQTPPRAVTDVTWPSDAAVTALIRTA